MIELIIAMAIIGILVAIVVGSFGGAKNSAWKNQARAAAGSYTQAIAQYQVDNGNQLPAAGDFLPDGLGPSNLLGKTYMGGVPAGVGSGAIQLVGMPGPATTAPHSKLTYQPVGTTDFEIVVEVRTDGGSGAFEEVCRAGTTDVPNPC